MKRMSLSVLLLSVTIISGVGCYVRHPANHASSVATHGSTETGTRRKQTGGPTCEETAVLGEARRPPARSRKPATVLLTNSLDSVELIRLMAAYRAERDPDRKHGLGIQLAQTGDASLVQFFVNELFADYGHDPLPQQEGLRLCSIPRLLALLGRRVPEARQVLIRGLDPAFWNAHISWSFEGDSATNLLVISCIEDVPLCEDERTWAALLAFRNQQSVDYLFHFSGAFLDAACTRYWMKKNGFEETLSRSVQQRLDDIQAWYKTADGKAWLKWKEVVEVQWQASQKRTASAKP